MRAFFVIVLLVSACSSAPERETFKCCLVETEKDQQGCTALEQTTGAGEYLTERDCYKDLCKAAHQRKGNCLKKLDFKKDVISICSGIIYRCTDY